MNELEWMMFFEVILLLFSALRDLYSHKIPNYYIIAGFIAGTMNCYRERGLTGILSGFVIGAVIVIVFVPLYLLRVFGAGDIKLLAVLCIYLRPENILKTLFLIFLTGAVFSMIKLIVYGNLCSRIKYLFHYGTDFFISGTLKEYDLEGKKDQLILPMAVPIFLGGILSIGGLL